MDEDTPRLDPERWQRVWSGVAASDPGPIFAALSRAYAEQHRAYHDGEHVNDCLAQLDRFTAHCPDSHPDDLASIEIAIWFHDAVYYPQRTGNEAASARWASRELGAGGAEERRALDVAQLILATEHVAPPSTPAEEILVDVDLSILGRQPEVFNAYEAQIRQEYRWIPTAIYSRKRIAILSRLLGRVALFSTPFFYDLYEAQARRNLAELIAALGAQQ